MLQMFERVVVLRENQQPFVLKFRRVHQFAQLQNLRFALRAKDVLPLLDD